MLSMTGAGMRPRTHLAIDNLRVLEQGVQLLRRIDQSVFLAAPRPLSEFGAGSHFRHCLDYYQCFLAGVRGGRVDYDRRERDERVERDLGQTLQRMVALMRDLEGLDSVDPELLLAVRQDAGPDE